MNTSAVTGVVFDLDGTLNVPVLDFRLMRRRIGLPSGDILLSVWAWPAERRARALRIIAEMEAEACATMVLQPGLYELVAYLERRQIPQAILTRNSRRAIDLFARAFGAQPFWPTVCRDDLPPKPEPDGLLHIARAWGMAPTQLLMVGDGRHDIEAARAAGAQACLLRGEHNASHGASADLVIDRLDDLIAHLSA